LFSAKHHKTTIAQRSASGPGGDLYGVGDFMGDVKATSVVYETALETAYSTGRVSARA
jgi:hypothetical protein